LPDNDPYKAVLAASEQRGQQYTAEQSSLQATGMFTYGSADKFTDIAFQYQLPNRSLGAVQGVLGSAGAVGAITAGCASVVGCGLGALVAGTSLDYGYAGFETLVSGSITPTYGEQVLQSLGFSPNAAALTYGAVNFGAAVSGTVLLNQAGIQLTQSNTLAQASYADFNPNGVKLTSELMKTPQAQALIKEIQTGSPGIPMSDAVDIAASYINSGTMLPQTGIATSGSTLIKVVPKGDNVSATTGYWMSPQQAQAIAVMTPEQAGQVLGLPAAQAANILKNGVDYYAITPKPGTTPNVFISTVASTTQGPVTMPGAAQQVIVPNRNQWTIPTPVNPFTLGTVGGR